MLSERLVKCLNEQINLEFYSSNLYLQMSSWCDANGYEGCATFLRKHATEEQGHMNRLFDYVNETGAMAIIGQIDAPPIEFNSLAEVFELTYQHECHITKCINELVNVSFEEKDFSTFNFLQWYVSEQHEEEHLFNSILDKVKLIGTEGKALFFLDQEIGRMSTEQKPLASQQPEA